VYSMKKKIPKIMNLGQKYNNILFYDFLNVGCIFPSFYIIYMIINLNQNSLEKLSYPMYRKIGFTNFGLIFLHEFGQTSHVGSLLHSLFYHFCAGPEVQPNLID
ncbi:hypothetical protein ACJX0J_036934, partial [Zea mays]